MFLQIKLIISAFSFLIAMTASAQQLQMLHEGSSVSLRGLAIYKNTVWVSGSGGMVGRSSDAGKTWEWNVVKGFEKTEFRDIEVFDEKTAVIMGIASPANILKTNDGGKTWRVVYTNKHPSMFLDAMSFTKGGKGAVVGDPIGGRFFVALTKDGNNWQQGSQWDLPKAINGEAFFAASGSNIVLRNKNYYIVSGGKASRFFSNKRTVVLPLMQGRETTGANAIAVRGKRIAVPGGDFMKPHRTDSVFVTSYNNGKTWQLPQQPPTGYRSSVCFINRNTLIACGLNGIDISTNGGLNWINISREGFNTCVYDKSSKTVYFTGNKNRVGKISF